MTPLGEKLRARIAQGGPITLASYMEACLADPEHGYYRARAPIGAEGDFTTSPEISQIFGELLGLCLAQAWLDQGAPARCLLVELGPGRGRLMADALRALRAVPAFPQAAEIWLIETSPTLRAAQAEALAGQAPRWASRLQEAPEAPLFLIANEFFDALPIRQWRREGAGWRERLIDRAHEGLAPILGAPQTPPPAPIAAAAPLGAVYERSEAAEAVAAEIGRRLGAASAGAALLIDYGYDAAQRAAAGWLETFQAVKAHAYADPFAEPGRADLTAHVDFSALADAAEGAGARIQGMVGQGALLRRLGAEARAAALAKAAPARAESIAAALGRLTDPREMGALFKALGLTAAGAPPLAGF